MVAVNRSTRCRFLSRTRTVILAVTNDCNMACSYCYQDSRFVPRGGKVRLLPAEVARAALSDVIRATSSRRVGVIFHGGEPTLAPQEWYREVVAPVSRLAARSGKSLQFHMQSNGQLIDDSWASCFRALAINVGISTDGPAEVSLPYRAGSENAARAVRVMQAHGLRPGAIVVATPRNLPVIARRYELSGRSSLRWFSSAAMARFWTFPRRLRRRLSADAPGRLHPGRPRRCSPIRTIRSRRAWRSTFPDLSESRRLRSAPPVARASENLAAGN